MDRNTYSPHLLEAQTVEVLPDEPDHVLIGLRKSLLLLQGTAADADTAASPHLKRGAAGGRDPIIDTRAATAVAVVGRRQQPIGVS